MGRSEELEVTLRRVEEDKATLLDYIEVGMHTWGAWVQLPVPNDLYVCVYVCIPVYRGCAWEHETRARKPIRSMRNHVPLWIPTYHQGPDEHACMLK